MMTHKYKVGDKVRMLRDDCDLKEGRVYTVRNVHDVPPAFIAVGDGTIEDHWAPVYFIEPVTDEPPQDNTDLTENRIPFGLLEPDVQERMKAWEHGHEGWCWISNKWYKNLRGSLYKSVVYRAKPAPVEPERATQWLNVYSSWVSHSSTAREHSDQEATSERLAVWRITYDKETGLNPVIEVEDM